MKTSLTLSTALAALLLAAPLALAQTSTSTSTSPATAATPAPRAPTMPAPATTSGMSPGANLTTTPAATTAGATGPLKGADRKYLERDARGASFELQISQLAAQKAQNPQVRDYAQMLVTDHQQYNQALQQVAMQNQLTLPTDLTKKQQKDLTRLQGLNGAEFDAAYVRMVREVNRMDVRESNREARATSNPQIKQFIEQFRQVDQKHADMAKSLPTA